jgi:ABC-2 type transport system permease protein
MKRFLKNIRLLTIKELRSIRADPVLVVLIFYAFTFAIYAVTTGAKTEVSNAAIAVVDEDHSETSRRIAGAFLPPYFREATEVSAADALRGLDEGRYVFLVEIPADFEKDLLGGRKPTLQVSADATAMSLAGVGIGYIENIVMEEVTKVATHTEADAASPIDLVLRTLFNPNSESDRFTAIMEVVNNVTMLAIILAGAALIREREHGTIEHLLVMPVGPAEIMLAKMLANGFVIAFAAIFSIVFVVHMLLGVPVAGSLLLFIAGMALYQIAVTGLGIMLATFANSMPQFTLLCMPVLIVMELLSGSTTPMESMPLWLRYLMQLSPSTHFVAFSQAVLYRGAGLDIVWSDMIALAIIGLVYFSASLLRFRTAIARFR